jgi:hypothetical protein
MIGQKNSLPNGECKERFVWQKKKFHVPVVMEVAKGKPNALFVAVFVVVIIIHVTDATAVEELMKIVERAVELEE